MAETTPDSLAGWRLFDAEFAIGGERYSLELIDQDYVIDRLIAENADLEQRNPYFGLVWPSAIALAREIAVRDDFAGKRVLDIGCGPGLLGIVAAKRGALVTFVDLMPESIALTKRNAARCGITGEFLHADLRDDKAFKTKFDRIVASDVLYERPLASAMLDAIENHLEPHGVAILTDPMRPTAHEFAHHSRRRGFEVEERRTNIEDEGRNVSIRIFEMRRAGSKISSAAGR